MQENKSEISFGSDNHAGVHPRVLEAIVAANLGPAHAYGDDTYTRRVTSAFRKIFGGEAESFFVFNGTAANVLGLKAITRPWEAILCSEHAHIHGDEGGAPEGAIGCKLLLLPTVDGKLTDESLRIAQQHIDAGRDSVPHRVQPRVISISQTTEYGTVYSIAELEKIGAFAKRNGLFFHMDGARLSNAAAALGVPLSRITREVGVDVLSFGGTKNGILAGEAVVFLRRELAESFPQIRKQGMQLASKMRFFSVQFEALLHGDLWKQNAEHANEMARLLAKLVTGIPGIEITKTVEANAVFAVLPPAVILRVQPDFYFYVWDPARSEVRWMTAFDTRPEDIQRFADRLRQEVTKA